MLNTLLIIGEWQMQGKGDWDRFLEYPKIISEDKNGNKITNYVLPILFDLDEMEVVIDKNELRELSESFVLEYKLLKTLSARNKKIYGTVKGDNLKNLFVTFFGNSLEDECYSNAHLYQSIKKDYQDILTGSLIGILNDIYSLKQKFLCHVVEIDEKTNSKKFDIKPIKKKLNLTNNENIAAVYIEIKYSKFGYFNPTPFVKLEEYQLFLRSKFGFDNNTKQDEINEDNNKLCYASGVLSSEVSPLSLDTRFSLNKMFVTETKNYASLFSDKNYFLNYQVSLENQKKLDYASKYLLKNLEVRIANIPHVIVPQFQDSDNVDLELALSNLKIKSDLLFNASSFNNFLKEIETETTSNYWVNFIAFDSDRKGFFKTTEIIKDISKFHFQNVFNAFTSIHWELKKSTYLDWDSVRLEYDYNKKENVIRDFNLYTIYKSIPIRKDKEKKNRALDLFKTILENRKVDKTQLFDFFSELILCYYYGRFNSYTNISKSSKDYFGISVKKSIFKYLAFIQVLKKINLIDMEETVIPHKEETANQYEKAIQDFFIKMQLNQNQQAMFYLGRMLNAVEYIQVQKKIKKTVINLVNFNGLDRDDIERLRNDLFNKARQHSKIGKVIFTNGKFGELFDYNGWKMQSTEALFFLLTGYSFGTSKNEEEQRQQVELEEENNINI